MSIRSLPIILTLAILLASPLEVRAEIPAPIPVQVPVNILAVDQELKSQVLAMLSGFEHFPSAEAWSKLPKDALKVLKSVAADREQWPTRRSRAVIALGYFPQYDVRRFLEGLLRIDDPIAPLLRRKAIRSLARAFGDQAIRIIQPYLKDEDFFVRETVIKSLGSIGTPKAIALIHDYKTVATTPVMLKTIDRVLKDVKNK